MSFIAVTIAAAALSLLVGEIVAWCPWVAARAIRRATRLLPREYRSRYEEEWLAELEALPAKGLTSLIFGVRILLVAPLTARALGGVSTSWNPRSKRLLDVIATSVVLVLVAPLMAAMAIAIRLDSKGPVFFRQVRVGRDGRHFRIFKFRSMIVDAEEQRDRLLALNEVGDDMFKISRDPRVTRVGSFLRKTSLDALPQLFNVLRGEMSLVGPHPLTTDHAALVLGLDRRRLHLTPGMTGPWQVLGSRVPLQEMVGIDYLYVASWSLWLDLKLLAYTVRWVLPRRDI